MERVNASLNIMRRMPPGKIEFNVSGLLNLMPDLTDELLQRIDQPLKSGKDKKDGRLYLLCDYNRDGDSYRSPWSNNFDPPLEDGFKPADWLRRIEEKANTVFDAYRQLYYEGGISSVYMWDLSEDGNGPAGGPFAGCIIIKKEIMEPQRRVNQGCWDSIHVVEVTPEKGNKKASYKLTTTVMLTMTTEKGNAGAVNLSGSLTRQGKPVTKDAKTEDDHVINIGMIVEEMEIDVRNQLDSIYIQKTRECLNAIRRPYAGGTSNESASHGGPQGIKLFGIGESKLKPVKGGAGSGNASKSGSKS